MSSSVTHAFNLSLTSTEAMRSVTVNKYLDQSYLVEILTTYPGEEPVRTLISLSEAGLELLSSALDKAVTQMENFPTKETV